jgi:hypothetical protein
MYGIGQSGGWNQSEIGFWKSFFPFVDFFFQFAILAGQYHHTGMVAE